MLVVAAAAPPAPPLDPFWALVVALVLALLGAAFLWPGRGFYWRLRGAFHSRERVRIEDALKHLHDFELRGQSSTLESLAGSLGMTADKAVELVDRLERLELVEREGANLSLTGGGRSDALRVIRIHRLWERYLADETGLGPGEWHREAEILEHTTSEEAARRLASDLGEPRYDPHGDPIPTVDGELVPHGGSPLTELPVGRIAEIVHIEDEPDAVYAQLIAEGLHLGMRVRVLEVTPQRIRFEADAEEVVLAPVLATNLSVLPLEQDAVMSGPFHRLSELGVGESARVARIAPACRGAERRRLLDLGVIPGTVVRTELRSATGDPTAYRIRGAVIALRREQADLIQIEPLAQERADEGAEDASAHEERQIS